MCLPSLEKSRFGNGDGVVYRTVTVWLASCYSSRVEVSFEFVRFKQRKLRQLYKEQILAYV